MTALMNGGAPTILRRSEQLDVIPGGLMLKALPGMDPVWASTGRRAEDALRDLLAPLANQYEYVIIDAPPGGQGNAAQLALGASDYCLIPTKADTISIQGVADMAMLIHQAQTTGNPDLRVLGVVMFDMATGATVENADARAEAAQVMAGVAPVLRQEIRESNKASRRARKHGMPVLQYDEEIVAGSKPWYEDPKASSKVARRAGSLAKDYVALTGEIMGRIQMLQSQADDAPEAVAL
jgi:cellulose biosynthesis protein BcsQ